MFLFISTGEVVFLLFAVLMLFGTDKLPEVARMAAKTIKMVRDIFGGTFVTDEGTSRYLRPRHPPPSPLSSGCYLARWKFNNALMKARLYLSCRKLEGDAARDAPSSLFSLTK